MTAWLCRLCLALALTVIASAVAVAAADTSSSLRGRPNDADQNATTLASSSKLHPHLAARMRHLEHDSDLHVIIGYRNAHGRDVIRSKQQQHLQRHDVDFTSISAVATTLSIAALRELDLDDSIAYMEPDLVATTAASQVVPPNIERVMQGSSNKPGYFRTMMQQSATTTNATTGSSSSSGSCADPDSFKIAIIDSGVGESIWIVVHSSCRPWQRLDLQDVTLTTRMLHTDISHYDLPCRTRPENCMGQDFGMLYGDDSWSTPVFAHGTHGT